MPGVNKDDEDVSALGLAGYPHLENCSTLGRIISHGTWLHWYVRVNLLRLDKQTACPMMLLDRGQLVRFSAR